MLRIEWGLFQSAIERGKLHSLRKRTRKQVENEVGTTKMVRRKCE